MSDDLERQVKRSFAEEYLERAYENTLAYQKAPAKRRVGVEPLFGAAKVWHGLARFRLRGLEKVNIESLLIAAGQNLKRLLQQRVRTAGRAAGEPLVAAVAPASSLSFVNG